MRLITYVLAIFNKEFSMSQKVIIDQQKHIEKLETEIERRDQGIKRLAGTYHRVNMLKLKWATQLSEQGYTANTAFKQALNELEHSLKPDTKDQA